MNDKERILDLVKKGVISSDEALILLESLAKEKDEKQLQKIAEKVETKKEEKSAEELKAEKEAAEKAAAEKAAERAEQEKKAAQLDAESDELREKLRELAQTIQAKEEQLQVYETMEELGTLTPSKEKERDALAKELKGVQEEYEKTDAEKIAIDLELKALQRKLHQDLRSKIEEKFDMPDDWKEQTQDAFNQFGKQMGQAGSQLGSLFKKTVKDITKTVNENVDWKDVNLKVPGIATTKFDHTFCYPETKATLIDVKLANGSLKFLPSETEELKVEAAIKLYGKMDAATPMEAFLERSQIDVDDETISFQIPNKRVKADLIFYLPRRTYDHVSLKVLNGSIELDSLDVRDIYIKATNGDVLIQGTSGTMLELNAVNGKMTVNKGSWKDLWLEGMNGLVTAKTNVEALKATLINGEIRLTLPAENTRQIDATTMNGNVKIALAKALGVEGQASTNLGSIYSRLANIEVIREKRGRSERSLDFRRVGEDAYVQLKANTKTGNVYLKDAEE